MDRNAYYRLVELEHAGSLSARRAWIEIMFTIPSRREKLVALRKESVDRNKLATF